VLREMKSRALSSIVVLSLLFFALACSLRPAPQALTPVLRHPVELQTNKPSEEETARKTKEQEETLALFDQKMDEYQNLVEICEKITGSEENAEYRASCKRLLDALKTRLRDLSTILESR
jgi:hypothetical protein